jgi:hypothetical protein
MEEKDVNECIFCKLILSSLKNNGDITSHIPLERRELIIKHYIIGQVIGFCRGFGLCSKHMATIKRDNKYRILKGKSIPDNLDLIRKLQESDI